MTEASYYAGVGSRLTPQPMLKIMTEVAEYLRVEGWTLRSGHAPGADQAFERGAQGLAEIYLPWRNFCYEVAIQGKVFESPTDAAMDMGAETLKHWHRLSQGSKKLHARNCHQVLGPRLDDPVEMVICWTEGGQMKGGTATAIKLARLNKVRIYNLGKSADLQEIASWIA